MSAPDAQAAPAAGAVPGSVAASAAGPAAVQVVRGTPDDVELAALVAGLVAASAPGDDDHGHGDGEPSRPAWSDRARTVPHAAATAWRPGPDAWRWSLRG